MLKWLLLASAVGLSGCEPVAVMLVMGTDSWDTTDGQQEADWERHQYWMSLTPDEQQAEGQRLHALGQDTWERSGRNLVPDVALLAVMTPAERAAYHAEKVLEYRTYLAKQEAAVLATVKQARAQNVPAAQLAYAQAQAAVVKDYRAQSTQIQQVEVLADLHSTAARMARRAEQALLPAAEFEKAWAEERAQDALGLRYCRASGAGMVKDMQKALRLAEKNAVSPSNKSHLVRNQARVLVARAQMAKADNLAAKIAASADLTMCDHWQSALAKAAQISKVAAGTPDACNTRVSGFNPETGAAYTKCDTYSY
ncbi:MAG: hypothetical protein WAX89_08085 [Alphaproteobacteria bacterium]